MISEEDDVLNGENSQIAVNWKDKYEKLAKAYQYVYPRYIEGKVLIKKALWFMNKVPNNMITVNGEIADEETSFLETINHYELCSRIDEFLKES